MRLILVALLSSSLAFAQAPDAPVLLKAGEPAPYSGRLLPEAENVRRTAKCAEWEATTKKAEESVLLKPIHVVAIVAGAIAVGAAVGVGATLAVKR